MAAPTRTDPPYVPLRHSRWPTQKTPRWLLLAGLVVIIGAVLVGLAHKPSQSQRAADLRDFMTTMNTDIESCAGGVTESLQVMHAIENGTSHDTPTAISIATTGAKNCEPANNTQIDDLTQYQVHESLASFHLETTVNDLVTWAFPDAMRVQYDVADVLRAKGPAARAMATAKLNRDIRWMNAQRADLDKRWAKAVTATSAKVKLPNLPG